MKGFVLILMFALSSFSFANQEVVDQQAAAASWCGEICDVIADGWFDRVFCVIECEMYQ
ncbi:hypothetical protein [Acanthopleuribacter pedis]|uniref:Uncharacterized protein n=1 Tax=Acanthopleuribacter pedis TaxID=442870 RepID=A0A8J7QEJ7_9BACT|nr:hypothetical protein [Acanthopleuribacter pedis]MBO1322809.1 hypothetical protein [Acanthopleuribacter pedis]